MGHSEAEDAGGLSPVKDDKEAVPHFAPPNFTLFQLR